MVSDLEDLDAIRECCEQQELLSSNGVVSVDVYKQLLTIYLSDNDMVNAKFLWKRIPASIKTGNTELQSIWKLGHYLWKRDFVNVYATAESETWSSGIQSLISKVCENLRKRMLQLVIHAYSVIKIDYLGKLLGLDESEVIELASAKSWAVDYENKTVKPKNDINEIDIMDQSQTFDQLMNSLTDYVSFLEN